MLVDWFGPDNKKKFEKLGGLNPLTALTLLDFTINLSSKLSPSPTVVLSTAALKEIS
jgi:hypothetical protein